MPVARGSFTVASWDESPYEERPDGAKLTSASVKQRFEGDVEGEGDARWLMSYRPDGTARFVGLHRVSGAVGGRSGSFVLETSGDFDGQMAKWSASVIPGSGTDELEGLTGAGEFEAPMGSAASFTLEYDA